jgi:hypothetical protein
MPNYTISSLVRPVLFSFALLAGSPCWSLPVENLYMAEVLVTSESAAQLRTGARAGLVQVLVRVSGSEDVESSSLIRNSLRNPAAYYNQYSYESTDQTILVGEDEVPVKILQLRFEPSAIARLLRQANFPVWGSNRPGVLLWVAVSDEQDRRIIGEDDAINLVTGLIDQAEQRGLPLLFPLLDLEDAAQISTAEVWGAFLDRVEDASTRYNPDAILTGRVQQIPGGRWSGKWSYRVASRWQSVESVGFSSDELVREMVDLLADELAARYALGSSRGNVKLMVEGVTGLADYAELSGYLEALTPVLSSSIVTLQGDVAEFELETEGQYQQLVKIIELDERLVLLSQDEGSTRLFYRWVD